MTDYCQSVAGANYGVHRVAYSDHETDKWLPDHRTMPKVIRFLGFLPWPAEPDARLHLSRHGEEFGARTLKADNLNRIDIVVLVEIIGACWSREYVHF